MRTLTVSHEDINSITWGTKQYYMRTSTVLHEALNSITWWSCTKQVFHNMFFSSCWCSFSKFYYKKTTLPVFSHYWRYCWHKTLIMAWSSFLLSTNQVEETNLPLNLRTESESLVFLDGTSQSVLGASFLCVLSVFRPSVCQGPRRLHRLPHRLYHTDLYYTSFLRIQ